MKNLSKQPEQWSKEIQAAFYQEFPFFSNFPVSVNLVTKDVKKGFAIGNIVVSDNLMVPVIINNYLLKDFDVAMYNNKAIPLTPSSILDVFSNTSAFQATGETMEDGKFTRLFNPGLEYPEDWGNTGQRFTKSAEALLPKVLPLMTKEAKERVTTFYSKQDLANFVINKTASHLENIAKTDPVDEPDLQKIASDNLDRDRIYIHKIARDKYKLYMMNSDIDDMVTMDINEEEFESLEPKFAEKVERPEATKPRLIAKVAEALPGSDGVISDGSTHIKIGISKVLTDNGTTYVEGVGDTFNHIKMTVTHVPSIQKVAEDTYLIPKDFKFYELGLEGAEKIAVDISNRVIKDDVTGHYTFQGPVFEKYAKNGHQTWNVAVPDAYAVAVQCGCCAEDLVKMAHLRRDTPFHFNSSDLKAPMPMNEFLNKWAELTEKDKIDLDIVYENLEPLLKIASKIEDDFVVDKVLSLGVINENSVKEYASYIPALEDTASYLARLLLVVRLGNNFIPEKDVEQAMEALSRIILHLKNMMQSHQNAKELKVDV